MRVSLVTMIFLLLLCASKVNAQTAGQLCKTNRNAPPANTYYWPPDTIVKVFFTNNMFTAAQRARVFAAMTEWSDAAGRVGAGVSFVDAGETANIRSCVGCLTITRRQVYGKRRKHYAVFYPFRLDSRGLLLSAWIDFDFATTNPRALQAYMAHELGHSLGLGDCKRCKKKQTIMSGFADINRDNGLISPSSCDVEVVQQIYSHRRTPRTESEALPLSAVAGK